MTRKNTWLLASFLVATLLLATATGPLAGRGPVGGGGGAHFAARPSMGPSASRPVSRPAASFSRPQAPVSRPASAPFRPSFSQLDRPNVSPAPMPTPRPSLGPSVHPSGIANRPAPLPAPSGERLGIGAIPPGAGINRPGIGPIPPGVGINRPEIGANPPAARPIPPGAGPSRPGFGERPTIGGGNHPVGGNHPIIGGGNNIANRQGGNNNFVNINRSGWGMRPGTLPSYGHWSDRWYNHHVPPHYHGWYHGCWSGHWGNYWYVPLVAGATAWGLNALLPSWGYAYGSAYANPYYVPSAAPVYDYSQPMVVNTYDAPTDDAPADSSSDSQTAAAAPAPQSPQTTEAYQLFDQALAAFKRGDYATALQLDQQALRQSPHDPVMHEIGALCKFAMGDYTGAAAVLNNLLAVAPGMDWTTLSGLYGDVQAYTTQLRALEAYCRQNPGDAAAHFVLAYHYLVAGYSDAAADQLRRVVAAQPGDQVAKRMLAALTPRAESPGQPAQPAASSPAQAGPTTDLVGSWRAQRDGDSFELSIDAQNHFVWKATPKGKSTVTLTGTMATAGNAILLQSKDQGTMTAQVTSGGPDGFQFIAAGSPPDDKGLSFQRVKPGN